MNCLTPHSIIMHRHCVTHCLTFGPVCHGQPSEATDKLSYPPPCMYTHCVNCNTPSHLLACLPLLSSGAKNEPSYPPPHTHCVIHRLTFGPVYHSQSSGAKNEPSYPPPHMHRVTHHLTFGLFITASRQVPRMNPLPPTPHTQCHTLSRFLLCLPLPTFRSYA